jgi:hypothetical protein
MRQRFLVVATVLALIALPVPAAADITAFIGFTPTPDQHGARGFAFGFGLLIVGFEGEYSNIGEDEDDLLPGLQTFSGNVLLQTPIEISGVQLYGTLGAGGYRERLIEQQETHLATNLGGGVKFRIIGPLRVRADYRVFRLHGNPLHETYHRIYVGGNLAF